MTKSIQIRLGWVILSILIGLIFPLSFLLTAGLLLSLFVDLSLVKASSKSKELDYRGIPINPLPDPLDYRGLRAMNKDTEGWLEHFSDFCESPAEVTFLKEMVRCYNLTPDNGCLVGRGLKLRQQVVIDSYRVDFLVDERLVVEIDGAKWHSSREARERDRKRDLHMKDQRYEVLRIPAKIALYESKKAVDLVDGIRQQIDNTIVFGEEFVEQRKKVELDKTNIERTIQRKEIIKPRNWFRSINLAINEIYDFLSEANERIHDKSEFEKGKSEVNKLANKQRLMIDYVKAEASYHLRKKEIHSSNYSHILESGRHRDDLPGGNYSNCLKRIIWSEIFETETKTSEGDKLKNRVLGRKQAISEYNKYFDTVEVELKSNEMLQKECERLCAEWGDKSAKL